MSRQYFTEQIAWATASGTAVANTTTETILFPNVTVGGNYMFDGRTLRLYATGGYGTTATPTLTFTLRWGGVSGTVMAKTGAIVTTSGVGAGASMTALWVVEMVIQLRANGATGTAMSNGTVTLFTATVPTGGTVTNYGMPAAFVSGSTGGSTPAVATVDWTVEAVGAPCLTADWSAADAANSIQGHTFNVDAVN